MFDSASLVDKASCDESFRSLLISNPTSACKTTGVDLPPGMRLEVHEDTACVRHVVLNDMGQLVDIPEVAKVIDRAAEDSSFRMKLKANPAEAIFDELGFVMPSSITLVVLENTSDTFHLVLESVELDDLTLAHVAGGKGSTPVASSGGKGSPAPKPAQKPAPQPTIIQPGALSLPLPNTPTNSGNVGNFDLSKVQNLSRLTTSSSNELKPIGALTIATTGDNTSK